MFYKCEFRKLLFLLAVPAAMASVYVRRFIIAHGSQDGDKKNKPTSLGLYQKKPYIALTGEGRLRLGAVQSDCLVCVCL